MNHQAARLIALAFVTMTSTQFACKRQANKARTEASSSPTVETVTNENANRSRDFLGLVSLVQVVANPDSFNGKHLQVLGFMHLEPEGNGIYISREGYEYRITKNALWLEIAASDPAGCKAFNDSFVVVEGTFNSGNKGSMQLFGGAIENITFCRQWPKAKR